MSTSRARSLPADVGDFQLRVAHTRRWGFDPGAEPVTWSVTAVVTGDSGEEIEEVGAIEIVAVDTARVRDPFDALDGDDVDLGVVAGVVFDGAGEVDDDLAAQLDGFGDVVLIVNSARLAPRWRGFGLGPILVGEAIDVL